MESVHVTAQHDVGAVHEHLPVTLQLLIQSCLKDGNKNVRAYDLRPPLPALHNNPEDRIPIDVMRLAHRLATLWEFPKSIVIQHSIGAEGAK